MHRTFSFFTLGCRTNQAETEEMARLLEKAGWRRVDFGKSCALTIVQTCTVTGRSDAKTRQAIRKIAFESPHTKIVVAGCGVHLHRRQFEKMKSVLLALDNWEKFEIAERIRLVDFFADKITASKVEATCFHGRTRATLKIQEGCAGECAYCIVPQVRGNPRSVSFHQILESIRQAVEAQCKEIILTGTHVGLYSDQGKILEDVLEKAAELAGDFRLHVSSIEPTEISERLIELVAVHPKICRHFHISFQHFSDPVLRAMKRNYEVSFIQDLLAKIRGRNPHVRIGTDVITGFPGEEGGHFESACEQIRLLPLHYAHVFRFSGRPGTPAMEMRPGVDTAAATTRGHSLRRLFEEKHFAFAKGQTGTLRTVLLENEIAKEGFTENYLRTRISCRERLKKNHFYPVRMIGAGAKACMAELI